MIAAMLTMVAFLAGIIIGYWVGVEDTRWWHRRRKPALSESSSTIPSPTWNGRARKRLS